MVWHLKSGPVARSHRSRPREYSNWVQSFPRRDEGVVACPVLAIIC
jgi:hypothetical protein